MLEFATKEEMLECINKEGHEDMVPVDQWDGECWKTFFDEFCVPGAKQYGVNPWDVLASFIKHLMEG